MKTLEAPLSLQIANSLLTETALYGGISINKNFDRPKSGFMVSVLDGPNFNSVSDTSTHVLSGFISDNLQNCILDNLFFGGWKDEKTGKTYFDLSSNIQDKETALKLAKENNQISIFDVETKETIYL